MDTFLIAIGAFIPLLLVLVVVHEFGHFATARAFGVKVLEFGIGYPPRAFGFYTGRTRVLVDQQTDFVNLQEIADLRPGQVVKVSSAEDQDGNLVARRIEAPQSGPGGRVRPPPEQPVGEQHLKHEGKVREVAADSFTMADMLYSLNWAPLGGFVRLAGESDPAVPRSLASKGTGTRFLVLAAGPLMNAILPIVIFTILFIMPQDVTVGQVVVARVADDSPAAAAGVQQDDVILEAGRHEIQNSADLDRAIVLNGSSDMEWLIIRGGREEVIRINPQFGWPPGRWVTGIGIDLINTRVESRSDPPQEVTVGQVVVTEVVADYPAEASGVQQGDIILMAGGREIERATDLTRAINLNRDSVMEWVISREGREEVIRVTPRFDRPEGRRWFSGISTDLTNRRVETRSDPPWVAVPRSFTSTWEVLVLLKREVGDWVSGERAPELAGPIGIAQATGEITQEGGLTGWLVLAILFSINLAILNILPIPMLDGGRLVFVVLEWVRRGKRVPPEKEGLVHLIGFVVMISSILLISARDIERLIQGKSLLGG